MAVAFYDRQDITEAKRALVHGATDRDTLALAHLPIAAKMGHKTALAHGVPDDWPDYVQEAALALLQAADTWDPGWGSFPQYAAAAIHRHLSKLMRKTHLVNIPTVTYQQLRSVAKLAAAREATPETIAEELGIPLSRAQELHQAWEVKQTNCLPLDAVVADTDGITVGETLADTDVDVEGEALEAITQDERRELWRAVQELKPLERTTICLNLGLEFEGATVAEVAKAGCVSRQHRVRQKLAKMFREGRYSAERLGFVPADATGKRPSGCRIVKTLSGHRA